MTRTILCYGDSNTFGTMPMAGLEDDGRFARADRWPQVMAAALGGGVEVIAEGLPGRTTVHDDVVEGPHRNGLSVLPAVLESHRPLDLVIVMLGTNDLKFRFSMTAWDIAASIGRLALAARATATGPGRAGPRVLVVCPPPIEETGCLAPMFQGGAAKSRALAAACRDICARLGLPMLDAGQVISVSPVDGIHYSAEAQHRLGLALADDVRHQFQDA